MMTAIYLPNVSIVLFVCLPCVTELSYVMNLIALESLQMNENNKQQHLQTKIRKSSREGPFFNLQKIDLGQRQEQRQHWQ